MAEVRWSLTAAEDLESVESTMARDSVVYSVSFVDHLISSAEVLARDIAGR